MGGRNGPTGLLQSPALRRLAFASLGNRESILEDAFRLSDYGLGLLNLLLMLGGKILIHLLVLRWIRTWLFAPSDPIPVLV